MPRFDVSITTRDGICPASIFHPAHGSGPWPAIIVYMDAIGIRPVMWEMGQQLADGGYTVLLPDLFYRSGRYEPKDPATVFSDPAQRAELMSQVKSYVRDRKVSDAQAFVEFLTGRDDVAGDRFGVTGYCMGGNLALTSGGAFPDRFAAVASFHGGNLASDEPDSPHRFVGKMTGRVYVAAAVEDASFPPEQKTRLDEALTAAGVAHVVEFYEGARHGFAVPDLPVYDASAAERHWRASFKLFGETLGSACQSSAAS